MLYVRSANSRPRDKFNASELKFILWDFNLFNAIRRHAKNAAENSRFVRCAFDVSLLEIGQVSQLVRIIRKLHRTSSRGRVNRVMNCFRI